MFLPEYEGSFEDWQEFLDFAEAWLSDPNDANWNNSFDVVDDDVINLKDFAYFASQWSVPSNTESQYYYLTDALGSVRGLVGGRFQREEDREFYNYDVYGKLSIQNPEESQSGNPILFAANRRDAETGLDHTDGRTYDPETGRWLQFDPKGLIDGMNLYEYVASNPTMYIDPFGTNLYAVGGTCERRVDNYNVAKFYRYYIRDNGAKVGNGKQYWDGPGTQDRPFKIDVIKNSREIALGSNFSKFAENVKDQVCKDYCQDTKMQVNFVGWSRGGAILLEVAHLLEEKGCNCECKNEKPSINWLGLFDAVEMTLGEAHQEDIPRNVAQADHAQRTLMMGWIEGGDSVSQETFPRVSGKAEDPEKTVLTNRKFWSRKGKGSKPGSPMYRPTTHSDIGTGNLALRWMMKRAEQAGLSFDWSHYDREN